jgi:GTP cyclohydrolase IA
MNMQHLTWADIQVEVERLTQRLTGMSNGITHVYGIPQGGVPVALLVAQATGLLITDIPAPGKTLIVDDLVDTGSTMRAYREQGYLCEALYRKPHSPQDLAPYATQVDAWLAFPWERDDGDPTDGVIRIIQHIGEDPTRDGLVETPKRVCKAMREMTVGYQMDPAEILSKSFDVHHDEMIIVTGVDYFSLCEHHMLPFYGKATIGYIPKPGAKIVGLSKLARLLDCYAKRLQVQERLTNQIAQALVDNLDPLGVGVVITGNHTCMSARGVQKHGEMVTSAMLGQMRNEAVVRAEFLALSHVNRIR